MNLKELDALLKCLREKGEKDLVLFYEQKRIRLLKTITYNIAVKLLEIPNE